MPSPSGVPPRRCTPLHPPRPAAAQIMTRMHNDPNVLRSTKKEGLLETLNDMLKKLERIQKQLDDYLEDRRRAFPRFYFLSNDDLLEILGHAREPTKVQPHLKKCFEAINLLELAENKKVVFLFLGFGTSRVQRLPCPLNSTKRRVQRKLPFGPYFLRVLLFAGHRGGGGARTVRGGTGHLGRTETQRGRLWTA